MRTLLLSFAVFATTACSGGMAAPTPGDPVSLVVTIDHTLFAQEAVLSVQMWNASQLATLDANARCAATQGPGGVTIQCPPGVTYTDVVPEQQQVPLSTVGATLELAPQQIAAGEKFRIHLSGLNRDRCNATAADIVATAEAGRTVLGSPPWQTTLRGCSAS
jgi:hypothetical protein